MRYVPDWFVTQQQIGTWYDDDYVYNDSGMIKWYDGYQKHKAQKAKIKELLPIAWHPERVIDWCMSGEEKRLWMQKIVVFDYLIQKLLPRGIF